MSTMNNRQGLAWNVHRETAGSSPEVSLTRTIRPFCLWDTLVLSVPGHRCKLSRAPLGLNGHPGPSIAAIIENEHQTRLAAEPRSLHDVQVIIGIKDLCRPAGVFLMDVDQRGYSIGRSHPGQTVIEIVKPKNARIALVRKDESIRQHLVVDDRIGWIASSVVVVYEGDRMRRVFDVHDSALGKTCQTKAVVITELF